MSFLPPHYDRPNRCNHAAALFHHPIQVRLARKTHDAATGFVGVAQRALRVVLAVELKAAANTTGGRGRPFEVPAGELNVARVALMARARRLLTGLRARNHDRKPVMSSRVSAPGRLPPSSRPRRELDK